MEKDSRNPSLKEGSRFKKSSLRTSREALTSKTLLGPRVYSDPSDMSRRKKVKFAAPVSNREESGGQDASLFQSERNWSSSFGEVKTSEYKSFKRLLEETNSKPHSYQFPKHDNTSKTFEASDCMGEKSNSITCRYVGNESLLPIQNAMPIAQRSSLFPDKIPYEVELENRSNCKNNSCSYLLPTQKVTPVAWRSSPSPVNMSMNCEHMHGGIFLKKRENILQLVAEASSQDVDEILSNKSDLIQELLQRLGAGQKSSYLDEFPKSGRKPTSGRYHSLASPNLCSDINRLQENIGRYHSISSPKSYGDIDKLQDTGGTNLSLTVRSNVGKDLLSFKSCEADEFIPLQQNHAEDRDFQNVLEIGSRCSRWQCNSGSDGRGNLHLHAEDKSASVVELDKVFRKRKYGCPTVGHMLSESGELVDLKQDYNEVRPFPTSHALGTNLQGKRWYSKSVLDEEGTLQNKSASTGYRAMDLMLPKADKLVTLSLNHAEVQAFPTLHALNIDLRGRRWDSNSVLDEEDTTEAKSSTRVYDIMSHALSKADELIALSKDVELQAFPASHVLDTDPQEGILDPHAENLSDSPIELSNEFEFSRYRFHTVDSMLSNDSELIPNNFPSRCHFTEQSIVPYINSTSSELYDFSSPNLISGPVEEHCTLPLLCWSDSIEPELTISSEIKFPKELDSLPLTLYPASDLLGDTKGFKLIDVFGRRDFFSSPLSSSLSTPKSGFKLDWQRSPLEFHREHYSPVYTNLQFEEPAYPIFSCIATSNRYDVCDDEQRLMEIHSHFPADISSFSLKFSTGREDAIFHSLPERLDWH